MRTILLALTIATCVTGCAGAVQDTTSDGDAGPCHDVPSCPTDGEACYLQADSYGRLVDLWACPPVATGNTPGCFIAHGCVEQSPCVTWKGLPDGGAYTATCWVQYDLVANNVGVVGEHPVAFWSCPADYADECDITAAK